MELEQKALDVFGDPQAAREWLHASIPSLGGRPCEMMHGTIADQQRVLTILGRIEHGVY